MVDRTRELECALGNANKRVAENERETVVIQRRCIRAARDLISGERITRQEIDVLRPAPLDAIVPYELPRILGRAVRRNVRAGDCLRWIDLE
jgi:sialic acid synthase SpsE